MLRVKTLDIDYNKRRYMAYIGLLFLLLMLDYFLTYLGVCYLEFGSEANPFMVWMFEIPLISGTTIRLAMCIALIRGMSIVYDEDRKYGIRLAIYAIFVNMLVLCNHAHWMRIYINLFY